ncbi:MAG TPA: hypothetical protein DCR25_08435 [Rhodobacter sp.]|jgi:hypothetical protein|nr:hypothetical protein [Rhodobacter sp.]HCM99453.1 hypothetical protein [Rhodobacter sp.]
MPTSAIAVCCVIGLGLLVGRLGKNVPSPPPTSKALITLNAIRSAGAPPTKKQVYLSEARFV